VPVLTEAGIKTIVNGPITFTPDANPLIGPAFGLTNCWLLTGSSMGVMEGGGAGKFLAEWIIGGEPPMDALALDPRRFGAYADRDYRINKAIECFGNQFAIHYPYEEREAGRPRLTSAIHEEMDTAGAVFGQAYGWERPNWFAPPNCPPSGAHLPPLTFARTSWFGAVAGECEAAKERVSIADMSVFSKFEVFGVEKAQIIDHLGANSPPSKVGRVGLIHALTPSGGIASEFTVTRLSETRFYLTSAAAARRQDHALLHELAASSGDVSVTDITEQRGVIALMGPLAPAVLSALTDHDLSPAAFPWLSAQTIDVAGITVTAIRVSYIGECGWELHADMAELPALYSALMKAGAPHGIAHIGAYAANAMRLEKGYPAWGMDLTTERSPIESGLARFVKTDGRSFTGRDALLKRPVHLSLKLLELDTGSFDPFAMHPVLADGLPCGLVTSGAYGHRTGKALAFAYLKPDATNNLTVEICGTAFKATILDQPPYDPGNERLRLRNP
ncbi:MAG: FAD-dependent oxidoreductase, partial [Hyphomicrobiales bacterium]|nr:FAD-dependent oxidoreductase [Hyphomicrobiales bacterium]